jgi:hypothetical protein
MLNELSLNELREMRDNLEIKVRNLNKEAHQAIQSWIESISGIKVILSRVELRPCHSSYMKGNSKVSLEYLDIKLVNDDDEEVFGADLTLSWYGGLITVNTGSCGEFVVLGEQKQHDKYQVLKYKNPSLMNRVREEISPSNGSTIRLFWGLQVVLFRVQVVFYQIFQFSLILFSPDFVHLSWHFQPL